MKENLFKAVLTAAGAGLTAYFGNLLIPIAILICVMVCDYISGMAKAWIKAELCSKKGIIGILKKLCYLLIVGVGCVADYLITQLSTQFNIDIGQCYIIGIIVTVWLIINECISILENVAIIGVPIPKFLTNIIKKLKTVVEDKAGNGDEHIG